MESVWHWYGRAAIQPFAQRGRFRTSLKPSDGPFSGPFIVFIAPNAKGVPGMGRGGIPTLVICQEGSCHNHSTGFALNALTDFNFNRALQRAPTTAIFAVAIR